MTVLLVDDQPMVAEAARRQLADQPQIQLHYCRDSGEAIEHANRIKPTLILQDLVMPQIDGLALVRQFRANEATAEIPIIVLSTREDPESKREAFKAGANDYLVKLPDKVELVARITYHSKAYLHLLERDEMFRALQKSERELVEKNDTLLALNKSLEDAAAALKQAKLDADRANHAKSDFLSRMSHELRTPMNAVLGFAQLMEMEGPPPRQRESLRQILKGGRHLLELINEILDLSRVEAGRLSISPEPVHLTELLSDCIQLVQPLTIARQIQFGGDFPVSSDHYVLADRQRLKQVMLNLFSNAVKYNRDAGRVVISCGVSGENVRIKVRDTGFGVPLKDQQKIFLPFERLDADRAGIEGTGLGLALSKRLVELMGGTIGVESTPDEGSLFWVDLPIASSPCEREEASPALPHPSVPGRISPEVRTVVYIEDNLSNLRLIESIMEHRPHLRLVAAMHASMGLDLVREHQPDLVLLDMNLPDLPGREVLRRLKGEAVTKDIPVIVISADATPTQAERMRSAGAVDYLTKPLEVPRFLALVDECLNAR